MISGGAAAQPKHHRRIRVLARRLERRNDADVHRAGRHRGRRHQHPGGEGAIWRTVVGTLFIALIGNGFVLLGLNPLYEQITLGGILLIAVGADAWSRLRTG